MKKARVGWFVEAVDSDSQVEGADMPETQPIEIVALRK